MLDLYVYCTRFVCVQSLYAYNTFQMHTTKFYNCYKIHKCIKFFKCTHFNLCMYEPWSGKKVWKVIFTDKLIILTDSTTACDLCMCIWQFVCAVYSYMCKLKCVHLKTVYAFLNLVASICKTCGKLVKVIVRIHILYVCVATFETYLTLHFQRVEECTVVPEVVVHPVIINISNELVLLANVTLFMVISVHTPNYLKIFTTVPWSDWIIVCN